MPHVDVFEPYSIASCAKAPALGWLNSESDAKVLPVRGDVVDPAVPPKANGIIIVDNS